MQSKPSLNVLFTWEMGGDLGHLARLRPVALELQRRGHSVSLAVKKTAATNALAPSLDVIPAPVIDSSGVRGLIREPATFADILFNAGFTQEQVLEKAVQDWRGIFDKVKPDVVVQDHSPCALLALQGWPAASALLGTGFACPPNKQRLPDIRAWQNHYPDRIRFTEDQVLQALNLQLAKQGQAALVGIGELFTRVDKNFLATFPELDHYAQRRHDESSSHEYCGVWSDLGGAQPQWPAVQGKRVFAYLKPFRGLPKILDHLLQSGHSVLVFLPADFDTRRWQSGSMQVVRAPLDMSRLASECDLALLHAGHGSTAAMLLAGTPVLQLPIVVEQYHTALNTERLGAGVQVGLDDPVAICKAFDQAIADPGLTDAAGLFSIKYAGFNPQLELARLVEGIEQLAQNSRDQ